MKKVLFIAVAVTLMFTKATWGSSYSYYYSQWTNNLFNVIEATYSAVFAPHQNNTEFVPFSGATYYYRLYNDNGLVVYVNEITAQHEVYCLLSNQLYYLGQLHEVDSMFCSGGCRPSYYNYNNNYSSDDWWNDTTYWDNPDAGAAGCYGSCSWSYATHTCNCND